MNSFDTTLAERLHGMVDGEFDARPPVDSVLGRAHAARRRRTTVRVASASLAVLATGGVIAGVATTPWASHSGRTAGSAASAQAPLMKLEAAVSATENLSYKIKVTSHVKSVPGSQDQVSAGAFAPATDTGYLRTPYDDGPGFDEQRLINGTLYLGSAGIDQVLHWDLQAGKDHSLDLVGDAASGLSTSADPTTLLQALRKEGARVTQSGSSTYHFAFDVAKQDLLPSSVYDKFSGDVKVGPDNRIASVSYERLLLWHKAGVNRPDGPPVDDVVTMDFSDYGTSVSVQTPTSNVTGPK